jgi:transposase
VKGVRSALRRRRVETYDVNEDYTSQLCNCCHSKLVPMYSQGGGMAIHGVRRCISATCMRKTLNRDTNAALNILYIFMAETLQHERPQVFTRIYQSDLARATLIP